ncbi:MAG: DUF6042 family protein [Acidimicrobiales bacterium]
MAHKRRKGGRSTAPKHKQLTGRQSSLRLTGPRPNEIERRVLRQWVAGGWLRWWPADLLFILQLAAQNEAEPDHDVFEVEAKRFDLDESVWEAPTDPEEAGRQEDMRIHLGRCSDAAGLPPVFTRRDMLALAEHYGLLRCDGGGRVVVVDPLPLVTDTGQLSPEDVANEDRLRWADEFEGISQRVIAVFVDERLDEWRAPLSEVAETIEASVEDSRQALVLLCEEGDFTVAPDPETLGDGDEVVIVVDWAAFDRSRFHLGGYTEDEDG